MDEEEEAKLQKDGNREVSFPNILGFGILTKTDEVLSKFLILWRRERGGLPGPAHLGFHPVQHCLHRHPAEACSALLVCSTTFYQNVSILSIPPRDTS